jgi:hypothetical protein
MNDTPEIESSLASHQPAPPSEPANRKNPLSYFLLIVILVLIGASGYLFIQNNMLQSQLSRASVSRSTKPIMHTAVSPSPAGPLTAWQTFTDPNLLFSLRYPPAYRPLTETELIEDPPNTLLALESAATYPGTVLATRNQFILHKKPDLHNAASCYTGGRDNTILTMKKMINGETFYYSDIYGGAAAGTHDATEGYRVFHNGVCYELDLRHFESSDWNNPGDVKLAESEKSVGFEELRQILSTFKFTDGVNTDEKSTVENFVKDTVFEYGKSHGISNKNQILITVTKIENGFATGTMAFTPEVEGSGGAWFAALINGRWTMIEQAQEPPSCKLMAQYNFPKSVYGECIEK